MPSKPLTVLIVVFVVAATWGVSQIDWTKDVPFAPPDIPPGHLGYTAPPQPADIAPPPDQPGGERPRITAPDQPGPEEPRPDISEPAPVEPPKPPPPPKPEVQLPDIDSKHAMPIPTEKVVPITIKKDGELRSGGVNLGSYTMVSARVSYDMGATTVIYAHKDAPWKLVYWAIQAAQQGGSNRMGLAFRIGRRTAMMVIDLPETELRLNPDMPELPVELTTDDVGAYVFKVFDWEGTDLEAFGEMVGGFNNEYALEFGGDYARDPAKSPWVFRADPDLPVSKAMEVLAMVRDQAVYSVRLSEDFPDRPK
jgi:biopolymer transport protein ExbD